MIPGYDHEAINDCLFPQATRTKNQTKLTQTRENTQQPDTKQIIQNILTYLSQSKDVKQTKKNFIEAIQQFNSTLYPTSTHRNPTYKKPIPHEHPTVEY